MSLVLLIRSLLYATLDLFLFMYIIRLFILFWGIWFMDCDLYSFWLSTDKAKLEVVHLDMYFYFTVFRELGMVFWF
jgi:hypothetical protein